MKLIKFIFLLFIIISISGCSSKTIEPSDNKIKEQKEEKSFFDLDLGLNFSLNFTKEEPEEEVAEESLDDLLDEFSDELEVKEVFDPLNGYNRFMTNVNDHIYDYVLTPVSKGYKYVLHREIRKSIENFFHNVFYPTRVTNNLLQGKFSNALEETGRFVINSTIGILGLFDPAYSLYDLEAHEEDFGQTLGFYGVGSGPHIVIPLAGPSNLRDIFGLIPESFTNPYSYYNIKNYWNLDSYYASTEVHNIYTGYPLYLAVKTFEKVNYTSLHIDEYEKLKKDAIDLYPFLRDVYEQYRDKLIKE